VSIGSTGLALRPTSFDFTSAIGGTLPRNRRARRASSHNKRKLHSLIGHMMQNIMKTSPRHM
jgi:hypothetical protein